MWKKLKPILVWWDKWINDKLLRGRWETISGRCYRRLMKKDCPACEFICRTLNKIDPGHCRNAYYNDRISHPNLPD